MASLTMDKLDKIKVFSVLPNLVLDEPVECEHMGILSCNDERIKAIEERDAAVKALTRGFTNYRGSKCSVSLLVYNAEAPAGVVNLQSLISFRNLYALSCIFVGARQVGRPNQFYPSVSDYFDFYAFAPTLDGKNLLHIGAALNSLDSPSKFSGQVYPDLPLMRVGSRAKRDAKIFDYLLNVWVRRFQKGRRDWQSNRLFRSLAVAYHASSVPKKNSLLFYDFGVSIALWVSAFEVLVHPGGKGKANFTTVFDMLEKVRFFNPKLMRKRKFRFQGKEMKGNAVQYLYWKIYQKRNDFLHGNPVTQNDVVLKNPSGASLFTQAAPLVYQVALLCCFDHYEKSLGSKVKLENFIYYSLSDLENALMHLLDGHRTVGDLS